MTETAFTCNNVVKKYNDFILGEINLSLQSGMVLGLIGSNGAGKSTLINCLAGLIRPDSGLMQVYGRKVDPNKADWKFDIGYVNDEPVFYDNMKGRANLEFFSKFYPTWSWDFAEQLIQRFECPVDKKVKEMSKGNKVKLSLISVFARRPRLYLFDEPTSGLDPVVRNEVLDLVWELLEDEKSAVFYTSHILSDMEKIVDELAFIRDGKITLRETKHNLVENWRKVSYSGDFETKELTEIHSHTRDGQNHLIYTSDQDKTIKSLNQMKARNVEVSRVSLEDVVVQLMKEAK